MRSFGGVDETYVTAVDQAFARLARKRVPVLESARKPGRAGLCIVADGGLVRGATNNAGEWGLVVPHAGDRGVRARARFEAATALLGGHLDDPVSVGTAVLAFETHLLD